MQTCLLVAPLHAEGEWVLVRIRGRSCSAAMEMGRIPHLGGKRSEGLACTHLDPFHGHGAPRVLFAQHQEGSL